MGKFKQGANTAATRTWNTIATPFRIVGEWWNALANVLRQGQSSAKNTAEVGKQTIDTLVDNFLNFSKVQWKRYQRFAKSTVNLASAISRRPLMIAWAGILSAANQWLRKPFQKLWYTPGKMFTGMFNSTRIFSKKKWFDFQKYDTHETGWETWINQIREKRIGFFGKGWSPIASEPKAPEATNIQQDTVQAQQKVDTAPKSTPNAVQAKPQENPSEESDLFQQKLAEKDDDFINKELADRGLGDKWYGPGASLQPKDKATSIQEAKKQWQAEAQAKKNAEIEAKKRKNLGKDEKEKHKKDFTALLENNFTEEGVLARAKKNNKGNDMETILKTLDKENPTFATFIDDEILAKSAGKRAAA